MVVKVIGRCLLGSILDHKRMTQEDLSAMTGIHKGQINEYIHNKRIMSLNSARVIANSLGCKIDDLYKWND
jgi:transcriptional regulator with XRE-family HTH domain